jgi:uncharacterized protein
MLGVLVNTAAILLGTVVGLLFKRLIAEELGKRIQLAFGFVTIVVGLRMALKFENVLVFIVCIALGGAIGWLLKFEHRIESSAKKFQEMVTKGRESSFAAGLTISSILFCVGGMAIVGSIESGAVGNHEVLFTKSLLDGITSIVLASVYGAGVLFSAIPVFLYQGAITLLASKAYFLNNPKILSEVSGVGGVLVMMIGLNLARISKVPVGDFIPAILLVLLWAVVA